MLKVGSYLFDGPFDDFAKLEDKPGVYVIVCHQPPFYFPIDCGESENVRDCLTTHERASLWRHNCNTGKPVAGVLYTTDGNKVEQELRSAIFFPCGHR